MFEHKIESCFLPINFRLCFACSKKPVSSHAKKRLDETVLLSMQNTFWLRNEKNIFHYAFLSGGVLSDCIWCISHLFPRLPVGTCKLIS